MFQAYIIRSLIDGKIYIGITSRAIRQRWNEHVYAARKRCARMTIAYAIAKHGTKNFQIEAVCCAQSWADACEIERILISQYDCLAPKGYNLRKGGEGAYGRKPSADAIERSAAKHRGKPCHPNTRAAAIRTHKGKPKSAAMRAKLSAALTGTSRSEETKAKIKAYWASRRAAGAFKTDRPYAHRRSPPP